MAAYRRVYDRRVSLWAWWEVVAAHHQVHDYACCHLQADCLESGISSGPLRSITSMGNLYMQRPEMTLHTFKQQLKAYLFYIRCDNKQKEHSPSPGTVVTLP